MGFTRLLLLTCALAVLGDHASGLFFIKPLNVYEHLIKSIHDYFNNTCIILLHATINPLESQGLEEIDGLLALQRYLSAALHFRTAIMDFQMFRKQLGKTYYEIKRPLFVLLNDLEDVREEFSNMSSWIAMAYPTWLVFMRDDTNFDEFFMEVHVPFDCSLMIAQRDSKETGVNGQIIREVYRIDRKSVLRSMKFGSWDEERGLTAPKVGLYQRRNNLYGHNIRVVSVNDPPVSRIIRTAGNEVVGVGGFFGEVVRLLQQGMNCTFSYKEAKTWGIRQANGTWTGTIQMLLEGEADLAATELMMTSDRMDAIQFTTPVYSTKCRTYIKRPDSMTVKWEAYMAPFATRIWGSLGFLIIASSAAIVVIKALIRTYISFLKDYVHSPSRFSEILFFVFGAFCGQGMESSLLDPVRLVHLIVHMTAVIVVAAYSAALISFLAIKTFVMPFTTMEGLLEDGTYRFGVIADSADYTFFQNTTDKILTVMFNELLKKETELPSNYLDGLTRVCKENKYAFMTMDNMAGVLQQHVDCTLEPLDIMLQTTVAMAMPPGSPYRGLVNSNILLLRDSGILQRLLALEWSTQNNGPKSTWTTVAIEDVMPLILFMLGAFIVTSLLLLAEYLVHRKPPVRSVFRKMIIFSRSK